MISIFCVFYSSNTHNEHISPTKLKKSQAAEAEFIFHQLSS